MDAVRSWACMQGVYFSALFGVYMPRLHQIWGQLLYFYTGKWEKDHGAGLGAFSSVDAGFRGWYAKVARDYQVRGRFGYVWDDGLGMPLGPRWYHSWVTYWLLGRLGIARMAGVGHLLFIAAAAAGAWLLAGPAWGAAALALCAISPQLIVYFTHVGKPEVFWWPAALLTAALLLHGDYAAAGLCWSFIAFCNLPCALTLVLYGGLFCLVRSVHDAQFPVFFACLLPGVAKAGFRLFSMYRAGGMGSLFTEQMNLVKFPWLPSAGEIRQAAPFALAMLFSFLASGEPSFLLLAFNALILLWANWRFLYHNDPQSIHLCMLCFSLAACAHAGTVAGALFVFFQVFPLFSELRLPPHCAGRPAQAKEAETAVARSFPCFSPMPSGFLPEPAARFFEAIPDGSRFMAEYGGGLGDGSASPLAALWDWTRPTLSDRGIEFVNEPYLRAENRKLHYKILMHFTPETMTPQQILAVPKTLGSSCVLAFTRQSVGTLTSAGFTLKAHIAVRDFYELGPYLHLPMRSFFLLQTPGTVSTVEGASAVAIRGSALRWQAVAGRTYTVRYRYAEGFVALQGSERIPIEPFRPFPGIDTFFFRLTAPCDGEIVLWFRPFPAFFPDWLCRFLSKR